MFLQEVEEILWKDFMNRIQLNEELAQPVVLPIKNTSRSLNLIGQALMRTLRLHRVPLLDLTSEMRFKINKFLILIHCSKMNQRVLKVSSSHPLKLEQSLLTKCNKLRTQQTPEI